MDDLLRDMGRRIMTRRKELCLTQEQVAAKTDLTVQTISTAERDVKALRPENMVKLCEALHMTADYLLMGKMPVDRLQQLPIPTSQLTPQQEAHLIAIVENYIAAVALKETE